MAAMAAAGCLRLGNSQQAGTQVSQGWRTRLAAAGRLAGGCKVQLSRAWLDRQPGNLEGREAATVDDGT